MDGVGTSIPERKTKYEKDKLNNNNNEVNAYESNIFNDMNFDEFHKIKVWQSNFDCEIV